MQLFLPMIFIILEFLDYQAIDTDPHPINLNLDLYKDSRTFFTSDNATFGEMYRSVGESYNAKVTELFNVSINEGKRKKTLSIIFQ